MTRILLIWLVTVLLPGLAWAQEARLQSELDDRGYLQAFLEDNLSDVGRDIRIIGFEGALSAKAKVAQITVADEKGIWLTLNEVGLGWNRTAVLGGVLDISELSAEEILLTRRPITSDEAPSPEATGFSLPDLPISIDVEKISASRIVIGAEVFGQAATMSLQGEAHLYGGSGSARLVLEREDGVSGQFSLEGAFTNATRELTLDLDLSEAPDGIAANLINLPGLPSVDMRVCGSGPLTDFVADIQLSTDGEERLAGQVKLGEDQEGQSQFKVELAGDIAPVFLPDYRAFFGDEISLTSLGHRQASGALVLEQLALSTRAFSMQGHAALSPDGWPDQVELSGQLAGNADGRVLLPLPGEKTYVNAGDFSLQYDRREGQDWRFRAALDRVERADVSLESAAIVGRGQLGPATAGKTGYASGDLSVTLAGLTFVDPALTKAIGSKVTGKLQVDWHEGAPVVLSGLDLTNEVARLQGELVVRDFASGMVVKTRPALLLSVSDLAPFDQWVGQDLRGAADLVLTGQANLLGGAFDVRLVGTGEALALGQPRVDPLLAGQTRLEVIAVRDAEGLRLQKADIVSDHASFHASADLKTGASKLDFYAKVKQVAVVDPGLTGAATLSGTAQQTQDRWALNADGEGPGGATLMFSGIVATKDGAPERIEGQVTGRIARLADLQGVLGQPVSGDIELSAQGNMAVESGAFDVSLDGTGRNLSIGNAMLDPLTLGNSQLSLAAHREAGQPILLDDLRLTTREVTLTASGESGDRGHLLRFDGRLRDLGLLAEGVSGPAVAQGTAHLNGSEWEIEIDGQGPNQADIKARGKVASDASRADLDIDGSVHMALLNPLIRPRVMTGTAQLDLSLTGPLALSSLTGQVDVANGRLILPLYNVSLNLNRAQARLANGQAQVDVLAAVQSGGTLTAQGRLGLSAPYQADMQIRADQVHLSDGVLYDTTVNGKADLAGPLRGGAQLSAKLTLGTTEIRIPEAGPSAVPIMADLEHVNRPAAVTRTLKNAGMISEPGEDQTGLVYPLDITIDAPSRIFVRGRGLDAELGGRLRITGTSADVIPQGRFELVRGRLDILGKRLTLTTGQVGMQGSFDPMLYFVATSQTDVADVFITVEGLASAPEVRFSSVPDRPQDEVLALLLFGRNITQISPLQALQMAAAVRTLAGQGGDGVVAKLRGSFALDDLDVATDESGVTNLRVGKYISDNIYSDVVVGSDGTSEVNLNLNISPSVKARGGVRSTGESTLGIFFERDY
ncbi:translocation/assembly module TamB domain-containing protein [Aliiroseovarius crassostreae]|uniref:translocation/assembly module TamB domain-containing protein n=1 Tax=Aliiroseovarius crassostreae TaxID=154981 RepID=UPI0021AFBAA6|nr:translocation/assembly module TamB domain-containing protein [Aliiroseovarius crassostreae]UWQ00274.1 translocation/assembly module TamB domain-containing protein [Aliiroseovarius crassostreae]